MPYGGCPWGSVPEVLVYYRQWMYKSIYFTTDLVCERSVVEVEDLQVWLLSDAGGKGWGHLSGHRIIAHIKADQMVT